MAKSFLSQFKLSVENSPQKTALFFDNNCYSYEDIDRLSNHIAARIHNCCPAKEAIIPMVLERTPTMIITMLGILKAGTAFLPISPSSPCSRIQYILEETQAPLFFCDHDLRFTPPENILCIHPDEAMKTVHVFEPTTITPNQLAYVMYTSGSTGNPKGVMIEHQSMMNLFDSLADELSLSSNEIFIALTDYTFDISLIELLMPLMLGASIVLTEHGVVADGKKIKKHLRDFDITLMQATPLTWEILTKNGWENEGHMKILVGGEKFKTSLAQKLSYQKGNIWNVYGPTETSMWSMIYPLASPLSTESVPLGKPLLNTDIRIIQDDESEIPGCGELYIGGIGLARGYLNAPELTQEKFIIHENKRFYKTGDLVIPHGKGSCCYSRRKDDQLKFGGIRIEAGEIESTIEKEPFIKKAIVKIHEQNDYYKTLAAYIEIDEEVFFSHDSQIISENASFYMKKIYDETYTHAKEYENDIINTCGWQNSFTGKNFSPDELYESYTHIKKRIKESSLDHVLEIGSGTGSLLLDYLSNAQKVSAFEISKEAIQYVKEQIPAPFQHKVEFYQESLINIHHIKEYSCVIVNSVLQYLPSIKALLDSLRQLIKATKDGGVILIGDVRSMELLDVFLIVKHFSHHPDDEGKIPSNLFYKSRDTEIVLSPLFFYALKKQVKDISWVDIHIKHGQYANELNFFRYDVTLHINKTIQEADCLSLGFNEIEKTDDIHALLNKNPLHPVKIHNIPYDRMKNLIQQLPVKNKEHIDKMIKMPVHEVSQKKIMLANELMAITSDSHEVFLQYQTTSPFNYLQLLLTPKPEGNPLVRPFDKEKIDSIHGYCREPFSPWLQKFCVEHVKLNVRKHVMTWVNPSIYIWVEKWPQTTNGKLDKKALTLPHTMDNSAEGSVLSKLKALWLNITGDNALISEEFWTHGVSSLSMYYFLATINETFHIHMTYHEFHQHNTMEKVAAYIEKQLDSN